MERKKEFENKVRCLSVVASVVRRYFYILPMGSALVTCRTVHLCTLPIVTKKMKCEDFPDQYV